MDIHVWSNIVSEEVIRTPVGSIRSTIRVDVRGADLESDEEVSRLASVLERPCTGSEVTMDH
jgi:hypothetical protein